MVEYKNPDREVKTIQDLIFINMQKLLPEEPFRL